MAVAGLAALAAACGSSDTGSPSPGGSPSPPPLQAVVVSSYSSSGPCSGGAACLVQGKGQRIGFFIVDPNGTELADVTASVRLLAIKSQAASPSPISDWTPATYHGKDLQLAGLNRGVYSASLDLPQLGTYGLEVKATRGAVSATTTSAFFVLGADPGIPVGSPAPASDNPIQGPGVDIATIDTGVPPDDMHYISIAGAIAAHHPMLIYMGTPGFCQTKTCGPEVQVAQDLEKTYKPKGIDFIHVETYQGGRPDAKQTLSTTFLQWKLDTEPWIILVDRNGTVVAKFPGATGPDEISPSLDRLLS